MPYVASLGEVCFIYPMSGSNVCADADARMWKYDFTETVLSQKKREGVLRDMVMMMKSLGTQL